MDFSETKQDSSRVSTAEYPDTSEWNKLSKFHFLSLLFNAKMNLYDAHMSHLLPALEEAVCQQRRLRQPLGHYHFNLPDMYYFFLLKKSTKYVFL